MKLNSTCGCGSSIDWPRTGTILLQLAAVTMVLIAVVFVGAALVNATRRAWRNRRIPKMRVLKS